MISSASKALKITKKNFNQRLIFDAWLKCRMQTEIKHCVMIGDQTFLQHTKTTWEVFQRGSFAAAAASRDHNKFQFWKKWKEQNFLDFSGLRDVTTPFFESNVEKIWTCDSDWELKPRTYQNWNCAASAYSDRNQINLKCTASGDNRRQ